MMSISRSAATADERLKGRDAVGAGLDVLDLAVNLDFDLVR